MNSQKSTCKSMPINIAAANHQRQRPLGCSRPSWILLNSDAYIGSRPNNTTAVGEGRDNLTIEASFWPAHPPLASNLFVHCPGAAFPRASKIISTAEDLLLFRVPVAVRPPPESINFDGCDLILYRAGGTPSLTRIPNPTYDMNFGLLPRAGDQFTVAALVAKNTKNEYILHRFDSEVGNWASKTISLEAPRKPYPVKIPLSALRLNHHITTTVITLGGEAGTMGWVDLWSGILLYDLFHEGQKRPVLRHMPLPMPSPLPPRSSGERITELGCPRPSRGIASVIKDGKTCLKLADLQIIEERQPYNDMETDLPCYIVKDWAVTTWINTKMGYSDSFDDWREEFTVWASKIIMNVTVHSELLASGLLYRKPSCDGEETVVLALHNLVVSEPTPSLNGDENVIYLMARPKRFYAKAWALAIDIKKRTLIGVSEFGTGEAQQYPGVTYCSSSISNYMNLPTSPGTRKT